MKTVYRNTRHPRLVKWSTTVAGVLAVVFFLLYCLKFGETGYFLLYFASFLCFYTIIFLFNYLLHSYTVDAEADTLTDNLDRKNTLRLSNIKTATVKETRKGKFRSLFVHDYGVGFMDIRTSQANAERIIAQIREANPELEVKHATFF